MTPMAHFASHNVFHLIDHDFIAVDCGGEGSGTILRLIEEKVNARLRTRWMTRFDCLLD